MPKNTSMRSLEHARILSFFAHQGLLGKSHFWQILSKYILLVENAYFWEFWKFEEF